ncbi:MAG: hypothetical protein MZV70_21940 [Desulfobacterales bacterium]|nr:hypothetical protein [Desulfobacterales bacterium]
MLAFAPTPCREACPAPESRSDKSSPRTERAPRRDRRGPARPSSRSCGRSSRSGSRQSSSPGPREYDAAAWPPPSREQVEPRDRLLHPDSQPDKAASAGRHRQPCRQCRPGAGPNKSSRWAVRMPLQAPAAAHRPAKPCSDYEGLAYLSG